MENTFFQRLLRSAKRERTKNENTAASEEEYRNEGGHRWSYYRTDMRHYLTGATDRASGKIDEPKRTPAEVAEVGWSDTFPELEARIQHAVAAARARGRKVIMVDLFGDADGASLGADVTIGLSLTKENDDTETHKTVTGNALQKDTQDRLFAAIDAEDGDVVFANFSPVGGLQPLYNHGDPKYGTTDRETNDYVGIQLLRLFDGMQKRIAAPGVGTIQTRYNVLTAHMEKQFVHELTVRGIPHEYDTSLGRVLLTK